MGDANGTQRSRWSDASQDASDTQTQAGGGHKPNSEDKVAEWNKVMDQLTEIGGKLAKQGDAPPRAKLREVVQNALRMLRACGPPADNKNNDNLDARFKTLEEKINAIATGIKIPKG